MDCGSGFALSTDSVLLGNFVNVTGAKSGIDLGCGTGILSLLLLSRSGSLSMTGIEISEAAAEAARKNLEQNRLQDRSTVVSGDLRRYRELFHAGSFDLVVSNPPYFPAGAGTLSPDRDRANARGEVMCTLEDLCAAAKFLCRWGGRVAFVYKPERLTELLALMSRYGLEPKRLRMVAHSAAAAPSLVLVEGKRGGAPGLKAEPLLVLTEPDGADSPEIRKIYRRDG